MNKLAIGIACAILIALGALGISGMQVDSGSQPVAVNWNSSTGRG